MGSKYLFPEWDMLRNLKGIKGCAVLASDGAVGCVSDFYFDEETWTVRYLVVETENWLWGRKVLIPTNSILQSNWDERRFLVSTTRKQIKDSPDIDTGRPVSRRQESRHAEFHARSPYWADKSMPGLDSYDMPPFTLGEQTEFNYANSQEDPGHRYDDTHLHRGEDMRGLHIDAADGKAGGIGGLLLGDDGWAIRYLILYTENWWPGRRLLIAPLRLEGIQWADGAINVQMRKQAIVDAAQRDRSSGFNRQKKIERSRRYGRSIEQDDNAMP